MKSFFGVGHRTESKPAFHTADPKSNFVQCINNDSQWKSMSKLLPNKLHYYYDSSQIKKRVIIHVSNLDPHYKKRSTTLKSNDSNRTLTYDPNSRQPLDWPQLFHQQTQATSHNSKEVVCHSTRFTFLSIEKKKKRKKIRILQKDTSVNGNYSPPGRRLLCIRTSRSKTWEQANTLIMIS